ncbi:MAG: RnfABCDGE type electron transport complex subunit D [Candidatus Altiarchaeota archaeon]
MTKKFSVRVSPHMFSKNTTQKIMLAVVLALLPTTAAGVYFFGLRALYVILASCASAVFFEAVCNKAMGRKVSVYDGSALLTGLLLALTLPPHVPLWIPVVGSFIAIAIAKQAFGGLGANIFNPALVGRAFLLASWPVLLTGWPAVVSVGSVAWMGHADAVTAATPLALKGKIDAVTSATSAQMWRIEGVSSFMAGVGSKKAAYSSLFFGSVGGSLGETSALLILLGGLILIALKIIDWQIPACFAGTVFVLSAALGQDPLLHVLSGGLMLGAFFMATDYVTTPTTKNGRIAFAAGCGLITVLIRFYGGPPEGITYSILLMNAVTPLIDRYIRPRRFGT